MKWIPRWIVVLFGAAVLLVGTGVVAWTTDVPFYSFEPGPVYEIDGLMSVPNEDPLNGETFMLTVVLHEVNALEAALAYFDEEVRLVERERVRPTGITPEEQRQRNIQSMEESKSLAIYVALSHLGYDIEIKG